MKDHSRDFHLSSNMNMDFKLLLFPIKPFPSFTKHESYLYHTNAKVIYTFNWKFTIATLICFVHFLS